MAIASTDRCGVLLCTTELVTVPLAARCELERDAQGCERLLRAAFHHGRQHLTHVYGGFLHSGDGSQNGCVQANTNYFIQSSVCLLLFFFCCFFFQAYTRQINNFMFLVFSKQLVMALLFCPC